MQMKMALIKYPTLDNENNISRHSPTAFRDVDYLLTET